MKPIEYPDLEVLFRPKSIAIVGATEDPGRVAGLPLKYALDHGYQGRLYPVNRSRDTVRGLKCYPTVKDIPDPVDVAMVVVPSHTVPEIIEECAAKEIKAVVIGVSGFAELDEKGRKLQERIVDTAKRSGMRICGPNTNGILNVHEHISLGYSFAQEVVIPGRLGYVTQSGALLSASVPRFSQRGVGMSFFAGAGNQADLEVMDYVRYLLDDPNTDVIATYVEGFNDPRKFPDVADIALERQKPLVMLKVGRSELAAKAAQSHTGSLASSDIVIDAICKQKGVTRVDDFNELIAVSSVFLKCKPPKGNRVGVITSSGGAIGMIADQAQGSGLVFADVSQKTKEQASQLLPWYGEFKSPFDIAAAGSKATQDFNLAKASVQFVLEDDNTDILLAVITPMDRRGTHNYLQAIVEASTISTKPIILFNPMADFREGEAEIIKQGSIPVLSDSAECVKAIDALIKFGQALNFRDTKQQAVRSSRAQSISEGLRKSNKKILSEHEAKELLAQYEIPVTKEKLAVSEDEAVRVAALIGYPVVLKVDSRDIPHKTEVGGVRLNIADEPSLRQSYSDILSSVSNHAPNASISGVLVQEMVSEGREVIVGISKDPQFGPIIMFGLGGVFVEVLKDVAIRRVPLSRFDAEEMVREIKGNALLGAFRGSPEADIDAIVDVLLKMSQLAVDLGDYITEIEINPLIVFEKGNGVKAVDALAVLNENMRGV
ncbi:MAG: acetate--CoA ligase family protein [Syntrophorhabdaceae bacterium]|nr:acetate--CoA ligase family protein [Syntrophorhabdaceae bacterium]MDD5242536.1 acetate--CoA ligase family protein [Syntrophorhabdaceae bacterium]